MSVRTLYVCLWYLLCLRSLCCNGSIMFLPPPSWLLSVPSPVRPVSRPSRTVPNIFLSLRNSTERISIKFAGGTGIVTSMNRSIDFILSEIGTTRTREQATRENSNRRQSVLPRCQTDDACWMNSQVSLHRRRQMTVLSFQEIFKLLTLR